MKQFTREEAIRIYESRVWKDMTDEQIVKLQLFQKMISVPFQRYHEALENVLGRRIFTSEFDNSESLVKEYLSLNPEPGFEEVRTFLKKVNINAD